MRLSEVKEVQLRFVHQVRQLEEQVQLTIVHGDSDDTFVYADPTYDPTGAVQEDANLTCGPFFSGDPVTAVSRENTQYSTGACPAVGVSINRRQSSSSRSLSSSPRCRRSAFSVDQRMPFITFWAAM